MLHCKDDQHNAHKTNAGRMSQLVSAWYLPGTVSVCAVSQPWFLCQWFLCLQHQQPQVSPPKAGVRLCAQHWRSLRAQRHNHRACLCMSVHHPNLAKSTHARVVFGCVRVVCSEPDKVALTHRIRPGVGWTGITSEVRYDLIDTDLLIVYPVYTLCGPFLPLHTYTRAHTHTHVFHLVPSA